MKAMTERVKVIRVFESFILGVCKCGCGGELKSVRERCKSILRFYLQYHYKIPKKNKLEYRRVYRPDHPYADSKGCVRYHRLVMEEKLGRYLEPWEVVDHINKDRQDNRPENLRLFSSNSDHIQNHKPIEDFSGRQCRECKSFKTSMVKRKRNTWRPGWYGNKEKGFLCISCYHKAHYKKKKNKNQSLLCYME